MLQRQGRHKPGVIAGAAGRIEQVVLFIFVPRKCIAEKAVDDPRRMPQKIADRDRVFGLIELAHLDQLGFTKLGNILTEGRVQFQLTLFDQHHCCNRYNRLGHRENPKQIIRCLSRPVKIPQPRCIMKRKLIIPQDRDRAPQNSTIRHILIQHLSDTQDRLGIKTQRFGICCFKSSPKCRDQGQCRQNATNGQEFAQHFNLLQVPSATGHPKANT